MQCKKPSIISSVQENKIKKNFVSCNGFGAQRGNQRRLLYRGEVSSAVSELRWLKHKKREGQTKFDMIKRRLQYIEIKDKPTLLRRQIGSHTDGVRRNSYLSFSPPSPGILHKGNGENVYLSQQPPIISTVMGNGFYRSVPCGPSCSGAARDMMLFAPVALASGPDGSLYVGDFNFVRRVHPDGYTRTILELK